MAEYHLKTPISQSEVKLLKVGDIIYISGTIYTARDLAHRRITEYIEEGINLPIELKGAVIYHCGPIVKRIDGKWRIIAAGPTTSARMEPFESKLIAKLGIKMVIGKGGMGYETSQTAKKYGAVYGAFTGGAAAIAATMIKKVEDVKWLNLGFSEAVWKLKVEEFGPIIVAIDSQGNNLHERVVEKALKKLREII